MPSISRVAIGVLGAIASGIGVLGFLTFVGAAIWVERYRGVGISATYAVPLLPRNQLLITGADQLFAPLVVALASAAAALAYLRQPFATAWLRRPLLLAAAALAIYYWRRHTGGLVAQGDRRTAFYAGVLVLGGGVCLADWLAVSGARAADAPRRIAFVLAVAGTTLVFTALETLARNAAKPVVRPLAILRTGDAVGLRGVYVGEDSSHVYLGLVHTPIAGLTGARLQARVIPIARSDIAGLSVGALFEDDTSARDALVASTGDGLLRELRAQRAQLGPAAPGAKAGG
jgi:hypothetical protein